MNDKSAIALDMAGTPWSIRNRWGRFRRRSALDRMVSIGEFYWFLKTRFCYRRLFGQIGQQSRILKPMRLTNVENIFIGGGVTINKYAFLLTLGLAGKPKPRLLIDDGCVIGHMNHITCLYRVTIGKKVLTADRVHISDNSHVFTDPAAAILDQGVVSEGEVCIGDGSWIGENASVLSCKIGKHCVIGANAVVVNDIPDFSVAVGAPARVVRRFDHITGEWRRVTHDREEAPHEPGPSFSSC